MDKLFMSMTVSYLKKKTYFLDIRDNESCAINSFIKSLLSSKNKIGI